MTNRKITLASASPRRKELMELVGVEFQVIPSLLDEEAQNLAHLPPGAFASALAALKAKEVAERAEDGLILGADTIVVLDDEIMGKPKDAEDARRMLDRLRGRVHQVYTGLSLIRRDDGRLAVLSEDYVVTDVRMRSFSPETLLAYLETGEPMDKAGAYAIQGRGALLIEGIRGDFFNVVGLPVARVAELLEANGVRCL